MSEDKKRETGEPSERDEGSDKEKRSDKTKIRFESTMGRAEAVSYFQAIVKGLEEGKVSFRQGDEELTLAPAEQIAVSVKAAQKGEKAKVSFEIAWRESEDDVGLSIVPGGSDD